MIGHLVIGAALANASIREKLLEIPRHLFGPIERKLLDAMETKQPKDVDAALALLGVQRDPNEKAPASLFRHYLVELERKVRLLKEGPKLHPCHDPETCGIGPAGLCDKCRDFFAWQELCDQRALDEMADRERLTPLLRNLKRLAEVFPGELGGLLKGTGK